MRCHIIHVAVPAPGEPFGEARLGVAQLAIGDSNSLKSELRPPAPDALRELSEIHRLRVMLFHSDHHKPPLCEFLPAEADTLALGADLAAALIPGVNVYLRGDLGAGKTTLARGILRGFGFDGPGEESHLHTG